MPKYFPNEFLGVRAPLPNNTILFVLNTTCSHCQSLLDQLVKGTQTNKIAILYNVYDVDHIYELTGITLTEPVKSFPHAVLIGTPTKTLTSTEMHERVFGQ